MDDPLHHSGVVLLLQVAGCVLYGLWVASMEGRTRRKTHDPKLGEVVRWSLFCWFFTAQAVITGIAGDGGPAVLIADGTLSGVCAWLAWKAWNNRKNKKPKRLWSARRIVVREGRLAIE